MTVAFDASTLFSGTAVTFFTTTHTPVGTPTAAVVGHYGYSGGTQTFSHTYGGNSMTAAFTPAAIDTVIDQGQIFGLANPPSGAQTVQCNCSTTYYWICYIATFTGSDTSTCFSAANSAVNTSGSSTALSVTVSGGSSGDLVFCVGGTDPNSDMSAGGGGSNTTDLYLNTSFPGERASCSLAPGASSVTATYTAATGVQWIMMAASVKQAGAAGPTGSLVTTEAADTASFGGDVFDTPLADQEVFSRTTRGKRYVGRYSIRPNLFPPPDYPLAAEITGSFAPTEAADVAVFSGSVFWDGSFAATDTADVASFTAVGSPFWAASLVTTDPQDVASFTATGSPFWTGSLATTDPQDIASFNGDAILSASLGATEAADIASFVASGVATTGSFAVTDAPDIVSFTATGPFWAGSLVATDPQDVAAFTATGPFWTGALAATDAKDVMAFTATGPLWSGSFAATDLIDIAAFSGSVISGIGGSLAATDALDIAAFTATGSPFWAGSLAAIDTPDSAAFLGLVSLSGQLAATDVRDIVSFITLPPVTAALAAIDPPDTCRFVGQQIAEVGVLNFGWPRVKVRRRL